MNKQIKIGYAIAKLFAFMVCVLSNNVFGQQTVSHKTDSSKKIYLIRDAASVYPNAPLYIIDDKEIADSLAASNRALKSINPNDILTISVLKDVPAEAIYGIRGALGVVIITTKMYAKTKYQNKLSTVSKEYKRYIESHRNDDSDLVYLLNGVVLSTGDVIKQLTDIPAGSIKSVDVMDKYYKGIFNNNEAIIVITTKR